jgi:hypothetical protein
MQHVDSKSVCYEIFGNSKEKKVQTNRKDKSIQVVQRDQEQDEDEEDEEEDGLRFFFIRS